MSMHINKYLIGILTFMISLSCISQEVQHLDSLIQVLHKTEKPSDKFAILNQLSNFYKDSDRDQAINFAKQALFIAESIDDRSAKSLTRYHLASILTEKKDTQYAIELLLKAQEGFQQDENLLMLAKTKLLLGIHFQHSFQFEKSLQVLIEALDLFKTLDLEGYQATTYNSIGGIYYDQNELDKAFKYYSYSLEIYVQLNNMTGIASLENNLGEIYRLKGNLDEALIHYRKSLKINEGIGNENFLSIILHNIGSVYLSKSNIDSARYFIKRSLQIGINETIPDRISEANILLGKLFIQELQYDSALVYIKSGYKISQQYDNLINMRYATELLSEIYAHKSDFKKALYNEYQFKVLSDSIRNLKNLEQITQLEMKLIFDHEQEIKELQIQSNNLKYFTLTAAIISIVVILILLIGRLQIITKHSKLRARNLQMEGVQLQDEIDYKNRELATNVMYMVRKNELINLISEKLFKVKNKFKPSIENNVQEIILDLQSNVDKDIWKVFQERFQDVHGGYYQKLADQYPNLTENDMKLCAFIKLNMSTKEIASITHQNPNTIDVNRTRLRKKLNLSNKDISLNNFLSNL